MPSSGVTELPVAACTEKQPATVNLMAPRPPGDPSSESGDGDDDEDDLDEAESGEEDDSEAESAERSSSDVDMPLDGAQLLEATFHPHAEAPEHPGPSGGCTAVTAMVRGNELVVANAGDSRCVCCRRGRAVEMTHDHKPTDAGEHSRIVSVSSHITPTTLACTPCCSS